MAWLAGSRQEGAEGKIQIPHQQWSHEPRLAERLPRPGQRIRDGSLPLPVHRNEPGGHERARCRTGGSGRDL